MQRIPVLIRCLWLTLFMPLLAYANPQQSGQSDCKPLISHSGFAEFVVSKEGGPQKLPIKASPSAKWAVYNADHVDWIEILDGDSGTGPGTMTIRLEANTGKYCRVGTLTISGVQSFYGSTSVLGSPIRILQPGTDAREAEKQTKPPLPAVIDLPSFAGKDSQTPGRSIWKEVKK